MRAIAPPETRAVHQGEQGACSSTRAVDRLTSVALVAAVLLGTVLRVWRLDRHVLNLDESYTASAGRRSVPDLLTFLRRFDSHPPLDYLLRAPLARAGAGDVVMRLPSVAFSIAALACLAWWLRHRGWFGVVAVLLMAISGYQLVYGREARMYALMGLLGVLAAMTADAWHRCPSRRLAVAIGIVTLVAVFDHVSGLLLACGLMAVPGLRRERWAWEWRIAVGAPVACFAVLWGPALLEQRTHDHTAAPSTSLSALAGAVGGQLTTVTAADMLGLALVVAGVGALSAVDRAVFRVVMPCAVLPLTLAAAIGLVTPVLIPRFVMAFGWAVPVAVAAALSWVASRSRPVAASVAVVVVVFVGASASRALTAEWPVDDAVTQLRARAVPGDVVAVSPAWYRPLIDWHLGVHGPDGGGRTVDLAGLDDTAARVVGTAPRTGHVWLLEPADHVIDVPGRACAPTWTDGVSRIRCIRLR